MFVYKIQVNLIHTILKYGNYYDFMDSFLWEHLSDIFKGGYLDFSHLTEFTKTYTTGIYTKKEYK